MRVRRRERWWSFRETNDIDELMVQDDGTRRNRYKVLEVMDKEPLAQVTETINDNYDKFGLQNDGLNADAHEKMPLG